jgi:hypothetical protein
MLICVKILAIYCYNCQSFELLNKINGYARRRSQIDELENKIEYISVNL